LSKNRSQRDTQKEATMNKFIKISKFLRYLLDGEKLIEQGSEIIQALLEAQSPRLTNISEKMRGTSERGYKTIQRFLNQVDLKRVLLRLYQEEASFVIGDPTEMERYKAPKTDYVGKLSDGETYGYWLMVLSTPFRGRAIPFWFITYSSNTIRNQATSRNQEHFRCFEEIKTLLGERPLVLDREFSYEELLTNLVHEQIQFVIRLHLGDPKRPVRFYDAEGQLMKLYLMPGETAVFPNVYYLGKVKVNLIGFWRKGLAKPMWIMTSLEPHKALEIYFQRMKIEETFRDCKDLLHLPKLMNKKQHYLEQMIALTLIAYVIGLWLGEALRDVVYGKLDPARLQDDLPSPNLVDLKLQPKWYLYSGLFVLLKQKLKLSLHQFNSIQNAASLAFAHLAFPNVRSFV
jgi:hypothetical protein